MHQANLTTLPSSPLSHDQQAFWFIYQAAPQNTAYNMALPLQFTTQINIEMLQQAVQQLVARHAMLRTRFFEQDGVPYQQAFSAEIVHDWQTVDANGWTEPELLEQVRQASQQPFILEQGVFRVTWFTGAKIGSILLFTLHHIAGDATSLAILGRELLTYYAALAEGKEPVLPTLTNDYDRYVDWETALLDSAKGQRMAVYWQKQLAGEVPILQLPTDFPRPLTQAINGASFHFELTLELTAHLTALAKTHNSTLFMLLLSAYQLLLHRYSGQSDIWLIVPTAIPRNQPEFADLIGHLINNMVVRMQIPAADTLTFSQLIKHTGRQMLTHLYHQPYPFSCVVEKLERQQHAAYQPLLQVMFAFERDALLPRYFRAGGYTAQRRDIAQMEGQFDLSLTWSEAEAGQPLSGVLRYNSDLFAPTTIVQFATHMQTLLADIVEHAEHCIDQLPLFTDAAFNSTINHTVSSTLEVPAQRDSALPRNALEVQLLNIWEHVLKVHPLGIHDNFFNLRGHSLLAVKLMSHIQQQCGVRLPVSVLFKSPTVATLAQQIQAETAASPSNLVAMQTTGQGHPCYCLPGALGSVMYLYPLATALGHPFYALQTPGLDGTPTPKTVTDLARRHIQDLQKQQPTGPYCLIGHSSGGRVAFEMAWQLEQQGATVAFLGILDINAPEPDQGDITADRAELGWLANIPRFFEELMGIDLNCPLATLQTLPDLETAYSHVMQIFIDHELLFAPDTPLTDLKILVNTYRTATQGHYNYQTTAKLRCPIHLFRSSEPNDFDYQDSRPVWGWAAHTKAEVIEQFVPGNHFTMMVSPHVQALAAAINTHCLKADL